MDGARGCGKGSEGAQPVTGSNGRFSGTVETEAGRYDGSTGRGERAAPRGTGQHCQPKRPPGGDLRAAARMKGSDARGRAHRKGRDGLS